MTYNLNSKSIKIDDAIIEKYMKNLGLTKEEAIQTYLEDEGYLDNDEQIELDKKAKDSKITATIHQAGGGVKKTQKERVRKENPTKEAVIAEIANFLLKIEGLEIENVEILNIGKLISFKIGENTYKLDLIQQRNKKK